MTRLEKIVRAFYICWNGPDCKRYRLPVTAKDPLQEIPGVGPRFCVVLRELGIERVSDLKDRDPLLLYDRLCTMDGGYVDRCVLYEFRCAVYYPS